MIERETQMLVAALQLLWPTVPVRDFDEKMQTAMWTVVLADVAYVEAEAVIVEFARTGAAFPPSVGVIAERVLTMRERAAGTYAPDADQALAEVMAGIRQGGTSLLDSQRVPRHEWSHPAVAATVRAMGWRDMCLSDRPDVVRAQFLRVYADAAARHRERSRRTPQMLALLAPPPQIALPTTTGNSNDDTNDQSDPDGGADHERVLRIVEPGPPVTRRRAKRTG